MAVLGIDDPLLLWSTLCAIFVTAAAATWALLAGVGRLAARTNGDVDDRLAKAVRLPLAGLAGLLAAAATLVALADRLDHGEFLATQRTFLAVGIVVGVSILVGVLRITLEFAGRRHERFQPAARITRRLVAVVLYAAAFLMVLAQYDVRITPLLTGMGIAGLAAALALQDTLGNFFAGISIQTGRAMQPGHYVKLEDEDLDGYVEEIGWRTTLIRTLSGNTIVIPNATLAQAVVTDYHLPTKDMSVVMNVRAGLEADPKRVVAALVEEAQAAYKAEPSRFDTRSEPFAQLSGVDEYSQQYSLIVRVPEYVNQWAAQHAVWNRIIERFRRDGIRIPYPTRHNYQEAVKPEAHRVPGAPGGFTPKRRPPRPRGVKDEPRDPREDEASKAKSEIAAKQREERRKD